MDIKSGKTEYLKKLTISLFIGYLITLTGIVILAILMLFMDITEDFVNIGIIVIYVLSSMGAGFVAGKQFKIKKYLWGMFMGLIYFLILLLVSFLSKNVSQVQGQEVLTSLFLCIGGGTMGGMLCP